MAYPLIIFGAGASYDYSPLGKVGPLTIHLTDDEFLNPELLDRYPGAGSLLSSVIQQVKGKKRSFEEVLTELKKQSSHSSRMRSHFAALEFYLQVLFETISVDAGVPRKKRMHSINNYRDLINSIDTYADGKACIVTFNYDTLFERNIPGGPPQAMKDYVEGDLKVIKLHGSHDWIYALPRDSFASSSEERKTNFQLYLENPGLLENLRKEKIAPYHKQEFARKNTGSREFLKFPALALPLNEKDDYICPLSHIQTLERVLPNIDRVLIIGWSAGDPLLLEILKNNLPKMGYKALVVADTAENAEKNAPPLLSLLAPVQSSIQRL